MGTTDGILFRNTGPVLHYRDEYDEFQQAARVAGARVYNSLTGKADMRGKQYLVDLYRDGYPVIPTVDDMDERDRLPLADRYVVKPKLGADSIGMTVVGAGDVEDLVLADAILQPQVDFVYEVSFYFVDRDLLYALYAPDSAARWRLEAFTPSAADREFARQFVDWNDIAHGIQRVDACRTPGGDLLLMELEDINPYLSLDLLDAPTRTAFVEALRSSLARCIG